MEHEAGTGAAEPIGEPDDTSELAAHAAGEPAGEAESARSASTGEPRVDAALDGLAELDELPVSEHPGVYERIHEQLVDVLGELASGQRQSAQQRSEQQQSEQQESELQQSVQQRSGQRQSDSSPQGRSGA